MFPAAQAEQGPLLNEIRSADFGSTVMYQYRSYTRTPV